MHFGSADTAGGGPRFTRTPRYSALYLVFPGDPDHVANAAFAVRVYGGRSPSKCDAYPGLLTAGKVMQNFYARV